METNTKMKLTRSALQSMDNAPKQACNLEKTLTRSVLKETVLSSKGKKNVVFVNDQAANIKETKKAKRRRNSQMDDSVVSDEDGIDICSQNALLEIPSHLVKPQHPLNQAWTLWYYCNDISLSWEKNQQAVATVATIEEFWQLYQLLQPASKLGVGCDYALFRAGIQPNWEDRANADGGRWVAWPEKKHIDEEWLQLLFYVIGEHADKQARQVNGVVVNVRKRCKLAMWLRESRNLVAVVDIGRQMRDLLGSNSGRKLNFMIHKESKEHCDAGGRGEKPSDIVL